MKENEKKEKGLSRRSFLTAGAIGSIVSAATVTQVTTDAFANKVEEVTKELNIQEHDEFPHEVRKDYKSIPSYSTCHGHGFFPDQLEAIGVKVDKEMKKSGKKFLDACNYTFDNDKKGYDQISKAVYGGAWALSATAAGPMPGAIGDYGLMSWDNYSEKFPPAKQDNNFVHKEKAKFKNKQHAADVIKRAARLYGADLVGITRRDERWDYSKNLNYLPPAARKIFPMSPQKFGQMMKAGGEGMKQAMESHTPDKWLHGWEHAGFIPKTVIVMAYEMDYESIAATPTVIGSAAPAEGYSQMSKTSHQLAVMIRQLGYRAIPCGNDTGMSVPYAIAAGLGEGSRMGQLVTYQFGPRVRISKVYTDFDFVEYDKPKSFGVFHFCKSCKRCADACPSKAIPLDTEPTFEPTHEDKDNAYFNATGVKKWYLNARKCFQFWGDSGHDCAACITACPYNKPDFWHHRLVEKINKVMPGAAHDFMREMDKVFGYGNTYDEAAVDRFFKNHKNRKYNGGI